MNEHIWGGGAAVTQDEDFFSRLEKFKPRVQTKKSAVKSPVLLSAMLYLSACGGGSDPDVGTTSTVSALVKVNKLSVNSNENLSVTVTFSTVPQNFNPAVDIEISAGSGILDGGSFSEDGLVYTATFTPSAGIEIDGQTIGLSANWTGVSGNVPLAGGISQLFNIDTIAPSAFLTLSETQLVADQKMILSVSFSESPKDFDPEVDIELPTGSGILDGGSFSEDGLIYTATFIPSAGIELEDQAIGLSANWSDVSGNASLEGVISESFNIDTKSLSAFLTLSETKLVVGQTMTLRVNFSEIPQGFDPEIDIEIPAGSGILEGGTFSE
ncbi:MAG: Ig-like domain-containing protein, partial [Paracoccaceae bacterium]|nr:Ig-like domain-containing protein [Paracoccaceae bacterium]